MNFIEMCLNGAIPENEIDSFVDEWHEDKTLNVELHEFLGMTLEEYSNWVINPSILPFILMSRRNQLKLMKLARGMQLRNSMGNLLIETGVCE